MKEAPAILRFVPPLWLLFFVLAGLAAHFFIPASRVFDFGTPLVNGAFGALVLIFGWGMTLHASKLFAEHKTEILPASPVNHALVTSGAYRYTRNPMYLGLVLMLIGIAIYVGTLPLFVSAVGLFLVLNFLFIPFEEEKMARQFGEQYAAYKQNVRRWF